jgi:hypothetical protein
MSTVAKSSNNTIARDENPVRLEQTYCLHFLRRKGGFINRFLQVIEGRFLAVRRIVFTFALTG